MERENEKEGRLEKARAVEKAAAEAQVEKVIFHPLGFQFLSKFECSKVKKAFLDDRKSKLVVDEREKQRLAIRAARGPSPPSRTELPPPPYIPGGGFTLTGARVHTPEPEDEDEDED